MNRRKAKKLHVGRYKQTGFDIEGKFKVEVTPEQTDKFHDELCDFVDKLGITFGGGWSRENFGFCFHSPKLRVYNRTSPARSKALDYSEK